MPHDQLCDDLEAAARRDDAAAFQAAVRPLWAAVADADAVTSAAVLERVVELLAAVPPFISGKLAVLAGALVENGAPPDALVEPVMDGLRTTLAAATEFVPAWREAAGPRAALPALGGDQRVYDATLARLCGRRGFLRRSAGLPAPAAHRLAAGWFVPADWAAPATTLLSIERVRRDLPRRPELSRLVDRLVPVRADLDRLAGLLAVLDEMPLIVLHRPSGRGYRLTIGGIGDNFQLHTLLADALIGDPDGGWLAGDAPHPAWFAAATTGPVEPPAPIEGAFNLVGGDGEWIWNEGRPADIPLLGGLRVVVLDPPAYRRTWNIGRPYPAMRPRLQVDEILAPDAAARWLSRVAVAAPADPAGPASVPMSPRSSPA